MRVGIEFKVINLITKILLKFPLRAKGYILAALSMSMTENELNALVDVLKECKAEGVELKW